MKPDRRPCLCGCPRTFARSKSHPLCKPATARVWAFIRELTPDDLNERMRVTNRVWVDGQTVAAIVARDFDEALRRIEHRAVHGLHADPDRALAAAS